MMQKQAVKVLRSLAYLSLASGAATSGGLLAETPHTTGSESEQGGAWTFHHEHVLGTSMELTVRAANRAQAEAAESVILTSIDRHARILSSWNEASELSQWMTTRGVATKVSPELMETLAGFDYWRNRTNGALDASAESAVRLWRQASAEHRLPTSIEIAQVLEATQQAHWSLNTKDGTATRLTDTPLALASFVKSSIAAHAADAGLSAGAKGIMLNIGGDIVVRGRIAQVVDITDPDNDAEGDRSIDQIVVRDRAVATSGSYRRGFDVSAPGRYHAPQFSHIVDPRTAMPVGHVLSSTVIASDASMAGALATAFSVMPVAESRALAAEMPGVEYLIVTRDGSRIASDGWATYQTSRLQPARYVAAAGAKPNVSSNAAWNQNFELAINLELARIDDPRYRRPYVAVWVEDADHFPVRTITLWTQKPRWLPDLKLWYRDDQVRNLAEGTDVSKTISSATRAPGKYSLKWDGKDNEGQLVKPGKYTICIEAAREHGTYQVMRQEMDFSGKPQQATLEAGKELGAATLDYRKR